MMIPEALSPEREDIRGTARSFLERRYDSDRLRELQKTEDGFELSDWEEIARLGWPAIALSEEEGGVGYGTVERCLLLEAMGRVLLPGPFLASAVLAADAVERAATAEKRAELLPRLGDGSLRATLAAAGDLLAGADPAGAVTATRALALGGPAGLVLDGLTADVLLVVAAVEGEDGPGLFSVDPAGAGVTREAVAGMDETRRLARVELDGAPGDRLDDGSDTAAALAEALDRSTIALAAEMLGGAQRCVDMTLEYVRDRRQFGVPIGSFQAIKHRCADMALLVERARQGVYLAAQIADEGDPEAIAQMAAVAKLAANDAYAKVSRDAIQLHGGIGYTEEHDSHLFYKRARTSVLMLGGGTRHAERLAEALGV